MKTKTYTIKVYGENKDDLDQALDVAVYSIKNGNTSGLNSNDTGGYNFYTEEENQ